jgi:hypothetical protein
VKFKKNTVAEIPNSFLGVKRILKTITKGKKPLPISQLKVSEISPDCSELI